MFDGGKLSKLISKKAISQGEFTARLSVVLGGKAVQQATVSRWVAGKQAPRPDTVRAMAQVLGVEPSELFTDSTEGATAPEPVPGRNSSRTAKHGTSVKDPRRHIDQGDRRLQIQSILFCSPLPPEAAAPAVNVRRFRDIDELASEIGCIFTGFRHREPLLTWFMQRIFSGRFPCPDRLALWILSAAELRDFPRAEIERLADLLGWAPENRGDLFDGCEQLASSTVAVVWPTMQQLMNVIDFRMMVVAVQECGDSYYLVVDAKNLFELRNVILMVAAAVESVLKDTGGQPPERSKIRSVVTELVNKSLHIVLAPPAMCALPVVAYRPDKPDNFMLVVRDGTVHHDNAAEFTFGSSTDIELGQAVRERWLDRFYPELLKNQTKEDKDWIGRSIEMVLADR